MLKFNRGERRYQRERLLKKFYNQTDWRDGESWRWLNARHRVNCRTLCSCFMCSPGKYVRNSKKTWSWYTNKPAPKWWSGQIED